MPENQPVIPELMLVLVNVFDQFGQPCAAAKVTVHVAANPAIVETVAVVNVRNIAHTEVNGQARLNLYQGQTYQFTITYKRYPPIVISRTIPTTGDSFVVTQTVA